MNLNNFSARNNAINQWNNTPCGKVAGNVSDLQYYIDVEKERYKQQYWQKKFFPFKEFSKRNVLEIGIGHGTDLIQFALNDANCYGVDITDSHISLTKKNFELRHKNVVIHKVDATNIDFKDSYFDCVYSFGVLHHVPEFDSCLENINRVLKPGGTLAIALYNKYSFSHLTLILRGLMNGKLFKLGYNGLLSTIEKGADGINIKPYVKLYTKSELKYILKKHNYSVKKISCFQVYFEKANYLNKLRFLEFLFGWYVAVIAIKDK